MPLGKGTQIIESLLLASSDGVPATDTGGRFLPLLHTAQRLHVIPYVWNPDTLAFEVSAVDSPSVRDLSYVAVEQGAPGTTQVLAADGTRKHKVLGCVLTLSAPGTLKFSDGVQNLTGAMDVSGSGGFVLPAGNYAFFETLAVNRALQIVTTGGAAKGVVIVATEV